MRHALTIPSSLGVFGFLSTCLGMLDHHANLVTTSQAAPELETIPVSNAQTEVETRSMPQEHPVISADNYEHSYALEERPRPSVTLRVVDEAGKVAEVPINFHDARIEPRGFWGDVAVNGMALFAASVCLILVKELFSWGAAKRQKAKAAEQKRLAAQRRASISEQLEAADLQLRELREMAREDRDDEFEDNFRRIMELLDAYRDELKEYDAPALLAYLDSLVAQATQALFKRTRFQKERGSVGGVYDARHGSWEGAIDTEQDSSRQGQKSAPWPGHSAGSRAARQLAGEQPSHGADGTEGGSLVIAKADQSQTPGPPRGPQTQGKLSQREKPDMDLVEHIMNENPGMHPSQVISLATELTRKRKERLLRRTP